MNLEATDSEWLWTQLSLHDLSLPSKHKKRAKKVSIPPKDATRIRFYCLGEELDVLYLCECTFLMIADQYAKHISQIMPPYVNKHMIMYVYIQYIQMNKQYYPFKNKIKAKYNFKCMINLLH